MTEDQFGWWLAGLVDGEGHFGVQAQPSRVAGGRPYLRCIFRVSMATGDAALLRMAQQRTGWGKVYDYVGHGRGRLAYTVWTVDAKSIAAVADFFEAYPLQSKKAHDFAVWAPAARAQTARAKCGRSRRDEDAYAIMAAAYDELRAMDRGGRLRRAA
jgi:hypothetical protein